MIDAYFSGLQHLFDGEIMGEQLMLALHSDAKSPRDAAHFMAILQLETQTKTKGPFDPAKTAWDVTFPSSGSYQLSLRDASGNLLAAASHWVSGDGVKATPGSLEIVLCRS